MRILIYGESWRGAMSYSVRTAFQSCGHDVDVFDPHSFRISTKVRNRVGYVLDRLLFHAIAYRINRELKAILQRRYDVVLIIKGLHVWPESVRAARASCPNVVNWNHDEFFNPKRYASHVWSPYIRQAFKEYDVIFTPRQHVIDSYRSRGARRVEYLPFAYDPEILHPVIPTSDERLQLNSQVAFIGSWSPLREETLRHLQHTSPIHIWGSSWKHAKKEFKTSPNVFLHGPITQERMPIVLACTKIALNMYTKENSDQYTMRNFEIPASRAFQLAERTETAKQFFEEDKEAAYFSSPDELREKCLFYLEHETLRDAIADAGHRRVLASGYTYRDRVKEMLRLLA